MRNKNLGKDRQPRFALPRRLPDVCPNITPTNVRSSLRGQATIRRRCRACNAVRAYFFIFHFISPKRGNARGRLHASRRDITSGSRDGVDKRGPRGKAEISAVIGSTLFRGMMARQGQTVRKVSRDKRGTRDTGRRVTAT